MYWYRLQIKWDYQKKKSDHKTELDWGVAMIFKFRPDWGKKKY
jgi:hypothetical protein